MINRSETRREQISTKKFARKNKCIEIRFTFLIKLQALLDPVKIEITKLTWEYQRAQT